MTKRDPSLRQSVATAMLFVACFVPAASARGQGRPAAANTITPNPAAFEVVSVKPSQPGCTVTSAGPTPGGFSARCATLHTLLVNAYDTKVEVSIPGLPGWASSACFDVEAKVDDDTAAAMQKLPREERWKQTQRMLQTLLADRFKLRVHHETREGPIYELVIAKSGLRLKNTPESEHPGGFVISFDHIKGTGNSKFLAFGLANLLSRTVVDQTGLSGNYEIDLKWTPDDQQGTPDAGPTLFTALEEQLGLKLVPAKGPVDTFVVDHVERPTEN